MIKSIFLDLDNTLLHNPDRGFVIEYLHLIDQFFQKKCETTQVSKLIRESIPQIHASTAFHKTNHQELLDLSAQHLPMPTDKFHDTLIEFYQTAYTQLKPCTQTVSGVLDLIQDLQARSYSIVIATNPIYPQIAVETRLKWAGLGDKLDDFEFITHSENMHFAKPSPEYYVELLARVGVEPDETLMIGDSLNNDIIPAQTLGIHTYHINEADISKNSGSLQELSAKIHEGWLETLVHKHLKAQAIQPQLRGNIGGLFGLLDNVEAHFWNQHPDPNEWSIMQTLCHLLASESEVQRPRLQAILNSDTPFLANPTPPVGASAELCGDDGYQVAHQWAKERLKTISFIEALHPHDWERPARHSIFGMTNLLEMAHFTAQHDRLHLTQLCQTIGNCS